MEMSLQFSVGNNLLLGIRYLIVGRRKYIQNIMLKAYFIRTLVSYLKKHIKREDKSKTEFINLIRNSYNHVETINVDETVKN